MEAARLPFDEGSVPTPESSFPTEIDKIYARIDELRLENYARTRNFVDGEVSYLSPYISRGVISPLGVLKRLSKRGINPLRFPKFVQELAWREFWQRVWLEEGNRINSDLRRDQEGVEGRGIPSSVLTGNTGIQGIDRGVEALYETGYMHNHVRMYTASISCNIARCHWNLPARWMYFHLLDGDWASNSLNWQWVAGTFSSKKYYANQENINRFCKTAQRWTFLDKPYGDLADMVVPIELSEQEVPVLSTTLPETRQIALKPNVPTVLHNLYSLDPSLMAGIEANRVLLLEPSHFANFPVSEKVIEFSLSLAGNIKGIQVFVGELKEFVDQFKPAKVYFREHPFASGYRGTELAREWIFDVDGYERTFFKFWKKCEDQLPVLSRKL